VLEGCTTTSCSRVQCTRRESVLEDCTRRFKNCTRKMSEREDSA